MLRSRCIILKILRSQLLLYNYCRMLCGFVDYLRAQAGMSSYRRNEKKDLNDIEKNIVKIRHLGFRGFLVYSTLYNQGQTF